jgi:glyoxylase-like metal-dependent hydrolase (beta-lactamase superfamily II)
MRPEIRGFFDEATNTVTYLVWDASTGVAAVIDPVLDYEPASGSVSTGSADRVAEAASAAGLTIAWILETHAHADHLSGAQRLRTLTGAPVVIGSHIPDVQRIFAPRFDAGDVAPDGRAFDRLFHEGDELALGSLTIRAIHTPGHTPACLTYLIGDAAFVGDTLFMPDYGTARADFPGGDATTLYRSIQRILALPPETRICVGHDYKPEGRDHFVWETTVAEERARNVHAHAGVTEADFVAMRTARDRTLAAPRLILPSLQVNIRAGHLPPRDADGIVRFRIPLTLTPAADALAA